MKRIEQDQSTDTVFSFSESMEILEQHPDPKLAQTHAQKNPLVSATEIRPYDHDHEKFANLPVASHTSDTWICKIDQDTFLGGNDQSRSRKCRKNFGRLIWLTWVRVLTFFLPVNLILKRDKNPTRVLAFKEKMTWVNQTILFYVFVIFGFLIFPSIDCSTITVEELISDGLVSAFSKLFKNPFLCQLSTFVNFVVGLAMFIIVFLAILSGIHSTLKLSYVYKNDPSLIDVPLVMHIPCYSEDLEDLLKTISSCCETHFDDQKKLLFVVCDGIVTGQGNDKATSDILIDDIFDCRGQKPCPKEYISTEIGDKQKNCATCYCGYYETNGHRVPYVLIVKVGSPEETTSRKPGNRGKRDSQLIIYRFFHQVIFSNEKVSKWDPLFKDIAQKMVSMIHKDPYIYEYLLLADADTYIYPEGIRELVSFLEYSPNYFGVCGETKIGNRSASFCAFTQTFEYFITHAILKAMENLCSDVLVLSGCYTIYRFRDYQKNGLVLPAILDPRIIKDYQGHFEKNLHQHNLLTIGEDRYLTVLALRYLPHMRNRYIPRAKCHTNAPVDLSTLLCQRRRWTNSLIHCHIYLLKHISCLPWRRIPAIILVMALELYYIFMLPLMIPYSLIVFFMGISTFNTAFVLAFTIGLPLILTVITWRGNMIVYSLAFISWTPVYSCIIPLYSIWKMDDFGWGSTRSIASKEDIEES